MLEKNVAFILIKAGEYLRGNEFPSLDTFWTELQRQGYKDTCKDWYSREFPRHKIIITEPFYIEKNQVVFSQFFEFLNETHYLPTVTKTGNFFHWVQSKHCWEKVKIDYNYFIKNADRRPNNPVTGISWTDTQEYIKWLSKVSFRPSASCGVL